MCFLATVKETDQLREMMEAHGGTMRFWKIVDERRKSIGTSSYVKTPLTYEAGTVVHALNGNGVKIHRRKRLHQDRRMTSGIYVRRGKPSPAHHYRLRILRVEAHVKDLIGSGYLGPGYLGSGLLAACFTKVKVLT